MKFAKIVFTSAGIWGLLVITPLFFVERLIGRNHPPAITHPEYFYGFACVAFAFQIVFLIIGRDPIRYRPLMLVSLVEKFPFVVVCAVLYTSGQLYNGFLVGPAMDLVFGVFFFISYVKTAPEKASVSAVGR
jgi:hypothetical protein